jgi:hypothetical protein
MSEIIINIPKVELAQAETDVVTAVEGVLPIQPVRLDLHEDTGGTRGHDAAAAAHDTFAKTDQHDLFDATLESLPKPGTVDISA